MEPPAKRLRILKSVEVDEDNPEYICQKRQAEAQLKNRFESIFARYENMPESMSDEIDIVSGKIVVDRGHLRGIAGKPNAMRAADFLEDLLGDDGKPRDGFYGYDEDEIDELAPPEPPKKRTRTADHESNAQENNQVVHSPSVIPIPGVSIPSDRANNRSPTNLISLAQVPQTPASLMQLAQVPPTPASLTQLAQLPPTAENQLVQNNFLAAFSQTMVQAVHQAFSVASLMGNASIANPPSAPLSTTVDIVAPATNPKWYFPPLPAISSPVLPIQSSPIPSSDTVRKRKRHVTAKSHKRMTNHVAAQANTPQEKCTDVRIRTSECEPSLVETAGLDMPHVARSTSDIQAEPRKRSRRSHAIYVFSHEDDIYIIQQKELDKRWPEIKVGRPAWKNWPLSALRNRWNNHLRGRTRNLGDSMESSKSAVAESVEEDGVKDPEDAEQDAATLAHAQSCGPVYIFTSDDDRRLMDLKGNRDLSWSEIKTCQTKWRDWPTFALSDHWHNHVQHMNQGDNLVDDAWTNRKADGESDSQEGDEVEADAERGDKTQKKLEAQINEFLSSPSQQRQLLTPSSLQHSGSSDMHQDAHVVVNATRNTAHMVEATEEDLQLSVAQSAYLNEAASVEVDDARPSSPLPEEDILLSIETDVFIGEEEEPKSIDCTPSLVGEQAQTPLRPATVFMESWTIAEQPVSISSSTVRKSKPKPSAVYSFHVESEADKADPVDTGPSPLKSVSNKPLSCKVCGKPFKIPKALQVHELTHTSSTRKPAFSSMAPPPQQPTTPEADHSSSDELCSSPAIKIKREPSTPRASLFSKALFKTPKSAPQPTTQSTATKLTRKDYLRIQQSWSKKSRKASPGPKQAQSLKKRESFQEKGKRAWEAESEEDSADELAAS